MSLRPSSLPKLDACAKYEGSAVAGPAADRGTELDALYRAVLAGTGTLDLANDDHRSVGWAVDTTRLISHGSPILSAEDDLRIEAAGMTGTADAAIPDEDVSIDLKTGEERDYHQQQAAYALGFMDRFFTDAWTIFLLYCDLRKAVKHTFTRAEAEHTVRSVIAKAKDPLARPTPCEYCDWCAKKFTCRERLEGVAWWAGKDPATIDWDVELADPARLAAFLDLCSIIAKDGGLNEMARSRAKDMLVAGTSVPGYALRNRKGSEFVLPIDVGRWIGRIGFGAILDAYGTLSAEKFRAAWHEKMPAEPFPDNIVQIGPGSQFIAKNKTKKTT
jgi:hypothetical protein